MVALSETNGNSTFQSFELEAESELLEIESMLSMFDDIAATGTTVKDKPRPQDTRTLVSRKTESNVQNLSKKRGLSFKPVATTGEGSSSCQYGSTSVGIPCDDMDIESILHEMNTIDGKRYNYTNLYVLARRVKIKGLANQWNLYTFLSLLLIL